MVEWIQIGIVGVDSGQLVICDPCYIDTQWKHHNVELVDQILVVKTGEKIPSPRKLEITYEHEYKDGMTYNEAIKRGILKEIPEDETGEFSYDGCCKATIGEKEAGQLNYALGHPGVGVAFCTGIGDGTYPVFAKMVTDKTWGRRISEVRIKFL